MHNLTEHNITEAVIARLNNCQEPRLKQLMASLVKHLHAFIREVEPTEQEMMAGIQFLTETGHLCSDKRQEFILLADTLGASILVDAINHRKPQGATESSVFGPFHLEDAPLLPNGSSIVKNAPATVLVSGRVTTAAGAPIAGALLDIWQTAPNGKYDVQDKEQPPMNFRCRLRTDAEGRYGFFTLPPVSYPIPDDGPVGKMLRATGRHPYRPAHIHFRVSAEGYEPVITMLFLEGDPYLESDAVFGVKDSLVVPLRPREGGHAIAYDFGLTRAAG